MFLFWAGLHFCSVQRRPIFATLISGWRFGSPSSPTLLLRLHLRSQNFQLPWSVLDHSMLIFNLFFIITFHLPLMLILYKSLRPLFHQISKTYSAEDTSMAMKSTGRSVLSTDISPVAVYLKYVSPGPAESELRFWLVHWNQTIPSQCKFMCISYIHSENFIWVSSVLNIFYLQCTQCLPKNCHKSSSTRHGPKRCKVHSKGYLRRDIRPDEFPMGLGRKSNKVCFCYFSYSYELWKGDGIIDKSLLPGLCNWLRTFQTPLWR